MTSEDEDQKSLASSRSYSDSKSRVQLNDDSIEDSAPEENDENEKRRESNDNIKLIVKDGPTSKNADLFTDITFEFVANPSTQNPVIRLLHTVPRHERPLIERLLRGQRFVDLREGFFGWNKKKVHMYLSQDLRHLFINKVRGDEIGEVVKIESVRIANVACMELEDISKALPEFKNLKVLTLVILHENQPQNLKTLPRSTIYNLVPDKSCVRVGEKVNVYRRKNRQIVEGTVVRCDFQNPSNVIVHVKNTGEEIKVVAESLTREATLQGQDIAKEIVWDWYCGISRLKKIIQSCRRASIDLDKKYQDLCEEEMRVSSCDKKVAEKWHKSILTSGGLFPRVFIGSRWKDCRVIPSCYVRCSSNLDAILIAPKQSLEGKGKPSHLYKTHSPWKFETLLSRRERQSSLSEIANERKSKLSADSKYRSGLEASFPSPCDTLPYRIINPVRMKEIGTFAFRSSTMGTDDINSSSLSRSSIITSSFKGTKLISRAPSEHSPPLMRKSTTRERKYQNLETWKLLSIADTLRHEGKISAKLDTFEKGVGNFLQKGQKHEKDMVKRMESQIVDHSEKIKRRRSSQNHSMSEPDFFLNGRPPRSITIFKLKNMQLLEDQKCPAFQGTYYSIGLRVKCGNKETVVSLECHTEKELEYWRRQFRYLREVNSEISIPVRTRAAFRVHNDLKWQGSFEEHFEFYCKRRHVMECIDITLKPDVVERFRCSVCKNKSSGSSKIIHVCPVKGCGFQMCTACAKENSVIGEGGFSEVHLAINKNLANKTPCVIKIFKKRIGHSALKKRMAETDVLFRLQAHPNIVKYQGYGGPNARGQLWIVMECCEGGSVLDLIQGMRTLMTELHIAYILHCVLRALAFLHEKKIAHKDIKAANILLTIEGFVKLSDFGISDEVEIEDLPHEDADKPRLQAGSPPWMPPEVWEGKNVTVKGDIWSLGITAIEMAEGRAPNSHLNDLKKLRNKILHGSAPRLGNKMKLEKAPKEGDAKEWSHNFRGFVSSCFIKNAKERPTAVDLLEQFPFMDQEQFKVTAFCQNMLEVMDEAGIFEIDMRERRKKITTNSDPPALICRKSLLHLIRYSDYEGYSNDEKEDNDREETIGTQKSTISPRYIRAKPKKIIHIKDRLFGGEEERQKKIARIKKKYPNKDKRTVDITRWGFFKLAANSAKENGKGLLMFQLTQDNYESPHIKMEKNNKPAAAALPMFQLTRDNFRVPNSKEDTKYDAKGTESSGGQANAVHTPGISIPGVTEKKEDIDSCSGSGKRTAGAVIPGGPPLNVGSDLVAASATRPTSGTSEGLPLANDRKRRPKVARRTMSRRLFKDPEQTHQFYTEGKKRTLMTERCIVDSEGNVWTVTGKVAEKQLRHYRKNDLVNVSKLGSGASGRVLKAFHIPTARFVAQKEIKVDKSELRHQVDKELIAFQQVQGEGVVEFEGAYLEGSERIVIVLEYMDLGSLEGLVDTLNEQRMKLDEEYLATIAMQALKGLQRIHTAKHVHRDIKPENFLYTSAGSVKVADLGLAKYIGKKGFAVEKKGTMKYLSPERFDGRNYDYKGDIWSLGLSLIFVGTGKFPLPESYWDLSNALENKTSPSLDDNVFSADCCDFISKCLHKDPEKRWSTQQLLGHPFIQKAKSQKEFGTFLQQLNNREDRKQALQREISFIARWIYHYHGQKVGEDIFSSLKVIAKMASQCGVYKTQEFAVLCATAWANAKFSDPPRKNELVGGKESVEEKGDDVHGNDDEDENFLKFCCHNE